MTEKHEMDRRRFLIGMVGLAAAGVGAAIAGKDPKPGNSPTEIPTINNSESGNITSRVEGKRENYWEGKVKEGENLTGAIERISDSKISEFINFELIWKHDEVDYVFKNMNAFIYQDIVPLPVVWPQDKIVFGSEAEMREEVSERAKLPTQQRVFLEAKNRTLDTEVEKTLTVVGGRFDRPVFYRLNNEKTSWEVNPWKDEWVDSGKLKKVMEDNPDMKSSQAFEEIK